MYLNLHKCGCNDCIPVFPLCPGDGAVQLSKYLLRTLCTDMTNMVLLYITEDASSNSGEMTKKVAKKLYVLVDQFLNPRLLYTSWLAVSEPMQC